MKKVLIIYFSQSGQLKEIADTIAGPLKEMAGTEVDYYSIEMETPFPFPWDKERFFDAFPESFMQIPAKLRPVPQEVLGKKYDLILLHYQVWFLSPSIPVNSFLKSPEAKRLLNDTPVITISGSRNMWFFAQEKIKVLLKENGALLKGNIALVDRAGNLISVITIVEWMFSGEKKKHLGIFPTPGVSDKDIKDSQKFGATIANALKYGNFDRLQQELLQQDAVRVSPYLVEVDRKGNLIFKKWTGIIAKYPAKRKILLKIFVIYLVLAIWVISPIVYILHLITYPFKLKRVEKAKNYFKGVYNA